MNYIKPIFNRQKEFFNLGKTNDINFRIETLKKLKQVIKVNENKILEALRKDLGKSNFEGYATEVGIVYDEINMHIKNIKKWARIEKRKSPIIYYPSRSYIYKEPYGVTLIIGPFNYPFQLVIAPLIGAISAGNTAIIKPSENTKNISLLLEEMINENFNEEYLKVVSPLEGKEAVSYLLDLPFDYIFFTGSVRVGKIVMEKAAKNLIPITLELGGKSPCIVDKDSKLELAAKRIVWGKFLNVGQTCVAPDYLFVHENIKDKLLKKEFDNKTVNRTLSFLKEYNLIDDEKLVSMYVKDRLRSQGEKKIKYSLMQKGISEELIYRELDKISNDDLEDTAYNLALKKYGILRNKENDKYKLYQKLTRYLIGRGYGYDLVSRVVKKIINEE